jgi:hypothetical protein
VSQLAADLRENIYLSKGATEFYWSRFWSGDATTNPDKILSILEKLREFYVQLHREDRVWLDSLPQINRWSAKSEQNWFTQYLSHHMTVTYGQPLDTIVAALTGVAFDLSEGVDPETVRGRRRVSKRPEKSNQKTR